MLTGIFRPRSGVRRTPRHSHGHLQLERLEERSTPAIVSVRNIAVGTDVGVPAIVRVFDIHTGNLKFELSPFGFGFTGGARVATGDINLDGVEDIIVGSGPGGTPTVAIFNGLNGSLMTSFFAYDPRFAGGVFVAVGDVNGDAAPDIITGADAGGGPHVKVFDGRNVNNLLDSFMAYDPAFAGGVRVGSGDVNFDARADIVTGAGPSGGPHVKIFDGRTLFAVASFMAYDPRFAGGVYVAAGDVNGDSIADVITGAGAGGGPHVKAFSGANTAIVLDSFFAYPPDFTGGVRVSSDFLNADNRADIITGPGPGAPPTIRVVAGDIPVNLLLTFNAFDAGYLGGVFVG